MRTQNTFLWSPGAVAWEPESWPLGNAISVCWDNSTPSGFRRDTVRILREGVKPRRGQGRFLLLPRAQSCLAAPAAMTLAGWCDHACGMFQRKGKWPRLGKSPFLPPPHCPPPVGLCPPPTPQPSPAQRVCPQLFAWPGWVLGARLGPRQLSGHLSQADRQCPPSPTAVASQEAPAWLSPRGPGGTTKAGK